MDEFISSDKRQFIYSIGRDLVWLLPGPGGPIASALITIVEKLDSSEKPVEWHESVVKKLMN